MRRLLPLVCIVVFADTMLFAAVIPLVPQLAEDYGLSKLGVGVLVGAYGAGALLGALPSGLLAYRVGPKETVVVGLVTLAVASALLAFADGAPALGLTRFAQGVGSAVTWAGALAWITLATPRERRGQNLGTAFGFAVLGLIVGPVVGALAAHTTITATFLVIAVVSALLAVVASAFPHAPREEHVRGSLGLALRDPVFLLALWLTLVPATFYGALDVLAPLAFDRAGWGTAAIAVTFVAAGLFEVMLAPAFGALSDRAGRLRPLRIALWGLTIVATLLAVSLPSFAITTAVLVVAGGIVTSLIYTPSVALVADRAEVAGLPHTLGFGAMNTAWAFGAMLGPAAGGAAAEALGDGVPMLAIAAAAVVSAVILTRPLQVAEPA